MNHHSAARDVFLSVVPERDAAVHQGDEGEGGALQGEDVAQVAGVSVEGAGTGVVLLVGVEVAPGRPAVVPRVSSLVNVEAVLPGAQSQYLTLESDWSNLIRTVGIYLDEDSEGSLLQEERASDVEISSGGQQLNS